MIEKFAITSGQGSSEFLDLNHISECMLVVSPKIPKSAPHPGRSLRRISESGH